MIVRVGKVDFRPLNWAGLYRLPLERTRDGVSAAGEATSARCSAVEFFPVFFFFFQAHLFVYKVIYGSSGSE